jgi:hypothetical protein
MAIGDTKDNVNRIWSVLPPWFPDLGTAPVLNSLIQGMGDAFAFCYQYLGFAALQTRIQTSTGGWLDLSAWDFFGYRFMRRLNESDGSFMPRILKEILRPRATRAAIIQMATDLTGLPPTFQEAWNPYDYGFYGQNVGATNLHIGNTGIGCGGEYGLLGNPVYNAKAASGGNYGYGALIYDQVWMTVFRPAASGIPLIGGYSINFSPVSSGTGNFGPGASGYGVGWGVAEYAELQDDVSSVTDAEIYQRIGSTIAAGITAWVDIQGNTPAQQLQWNFTSSFNSQLLVFGYI